MQQELENDVEYMAEYIRRGNLPVDLPVLLHPAVLLPSPAGFSLGPRPSSFSQEFTNRILAVNRGRRQVDTNPENRVTAYTIAGVQCCLPGLGEDLRFPRSWTVQMALNSGLWIRRATEEEARVSGKWYTLLEFEPKAILFSNGTNAFDQELLSACGDTVTVLAQPHVLPPTETPFPGFLEECIDVSGLGTPPTPPPESSASE